MSTSNVPWADREVGVGVGTGVGVCVAVAVGVLSAVAVATTVGVEGPKRISRSTAIMTNARRSTEISTHAHEGNPRRRSSAGADCGGDSVMPSR